ncbi:MAG: tryptophan synthase subunit alpha [Alphaproteobacteria bacterium]|nr:tryptophan synthase subunit alpha [Alphaproteobacteria bacterium]
MSRIAARFAALKEAKKKAFIAFLTAGDPDLKTFADMLAGLPKAGADLIEIGMPFSDPMADGPIIEQADLRAFAAGINMALILDSVVRFRKQDNDTPIILMGYANPVYSYGIEKFVSAAKKAGVDGLIIADLPPEEDSELRKAAQAQGLDIIRLITPTTDAKRLPVVLKDAGGFLYYVAVTGTTGGKQAVTEPVRRAIEAIRPHTNLPVAVGFGISTPEQAQSIAKISDAVIVASAIINRIASNLDAQGKAKPGLVKDALGFVETLAQATHKG